MGFLVSSDNEKSRTLLEFNELEVDINAANYEPALLCGASKGFVKAFCKTFWGTTKKCENKNLI